MDVVFKFDYTDDNFTVMCIFWLGRRQCSIQNKSRWRKANIFSKSCGNKRQRKWRRTLNSQFNISIRHHIWAGVAAVWNKVSLGTRPVWVLQQKPRRRQESRCKKQEEKKKDKKKKRGETKSNPQKYSAEEYLRYSKLLHVEAS